MQQHFGGLLVALRIRHGTTYGYRRPVSMGPHRLMLRPRESRDLRLISSEINVTSAGVLTWAQDVFGNAVATVTFFRHDGRPDDRRCRGSRTSRFGVAGVRHRGYGDRISLSICGRRMELIWARPPSNNMPTQTGVCDNGREILSAAVRQIRSRCSRTSAPAFPAG